jgi:hypothetical protein
MKDYDRIVKVRDSDGARAGEESGAGFRSSMLFASSALCRFDGEDDLEPVRVCNA